MSALSWIVLFCLLVGMLSVMAAGLFLLLPQPLRTRLLPHLISFATGALLGAAFLALLPHALETVPDSDTHRVTFVVLLGLLGFFVMEKMVLWRHCHHADCEAHHAREVNELHSGVAGPLIVVGDAVHNLIHGVLIAAAFLVDIHLGIVTSLAVMAHQIPQELSNFAVLLHGGLSRTRALLLNTLSSLTAPLGGVIGYFGLNGVEWLMPYMLAIAVSSCIYIAVADLIPGLHKRTEMSASIQQVLLIGSGVAIIYLTHLLLHE